MGVAALIIGILALILSFVPCVGLFATLPALIGLGLAIPGAICAKKAGRSAGTAIAGIVLNILALLCVTFQCLVFTSAATDENLMKELDKQSSYSSEF